MAGRRPAGGNRSFKTRVVTVKTLLIVNDPPYGTERLYNGLRLATALARRAGEEVRVFLMGDAAAGARTGQQTPNGYYNIERMLRALAPLGAPVAICGSCMDARGLGAEQVVEGARRSSMDELTDWTQWADRVLVF
jgi:uncharacterized protein involved in oxidation of intracellular sulfur